MPRCENSASSPSSARRSHLPRRSTARTVAPRIVSAKARAPPAPAMTNRRGDSSTRVSVPRLSHFSRFRRATSTSGSSGNGALALDLGGDVTQRQEAIVEREPIERRLERALLVHQADAQIGLLGHELGGDAVLLGADEIDAVQLEVEEVALAHR